MPNFNADLISGAIAALLVGLGRGGLASMGTFGVPVMAFTMSPIRAAAILLPVMVFSDVFALCLYRRHFSGRNLRILLPAAAVGIATGWIAARSISDAGVGILIGVIGIGFCINTWRMRHHTPKRHDADLPRGTLWGWFMGFASFVSHAGAPPFQIYVMPQRLPKQVYAGTSAITFAIVNALKLIPYWALGQFAAPNLKLAVWLLPPVLAGTFIGVRLVQIIPEKAYYAFLQIALLAVSTELIIRGVRSY